MGVFLLSSTELIKNQTQINKTRHLQMHLLPLMTWLKPSYDKLHNKLLLQIMQHFDVSQRRPNSEEPFYLCQIIII